MTVLTLHLPLPPPLSACFTNALGPGRVKTARYRAWIQEALLTAQVQIARTMPSVHGVVPMTFDVRADYQFGKPDKRRADVANLEKAVSDLLVRAGILADDSQIVDLRLRWADVDGCVVTIWPA